MSDLDAFRAEVRGWLEANCPAEMREPIREEGDVCWGGRNWVFKNDAQKAWLERYTETTPAEETQTSRTIQNMSDCCCRSIKEKKNT